MRQVLQYRRSGATRVVEVPAPLTPDGGILVQNQWSLISPGTERMLVEASGSNLLNTARQRPDLAYLPTQPGRNHPRHRFLPRRLRRDPPALLASPVPSPPRYAGRAAYVTDFIVRADSPHETLADTFGGAIAYSTEHSHSGYNAPRHHLLKHVSLQVGSDIRKENMFGLPVFFRQLRLEVGKHV